MANNPNLYNAVIAGATGANQQRWITDPVSANYSAFQAAVTALATVVDDAIAPIPGDASVAASALMQSIVQGVFADRFVQSDQQAAYDSIVGPIVALWTELSAALEPGTGGGGSVAPLAYTLFCDVNTEVPTLDQDGSIAAPFATLQQAHDAFDPDIGGTIIVCQSDGDTSYTAVSVDRRISIFGLTSGVGRVEIDEVGVTNTSPVDLQNVHCSAVVITGEDDFNMTANNCDFTQIDAGGNVTLVNCDVSGSISASVLDVTDCTINGTINTSAGIIARGSQLGGDSDDQMTAGNQGAFFDSCTVEDYEITIAIGALRARNSTIEGEDTITCQSAEFSGCTIGHAMDISGSLSADNTEFVGFGEGTSPISCASAALYSCTLTGDLTVSAELIIDSATYQKALNSGWSIPITGINFVISDPPISSAISIVVPASDTSTTTYVNTTLVGTDLEDLFDSGDPVIVNPAADIAGAGAVIASARISATNTLRVGFRGVTTGGAQNFVVSRVR